MNDKLKIKSLSIIITEECNLNCIHCMRGNNGNNCVSFESLEKLLSELKEIYFLSITGGEPFLNTDGIKNIVYLIKKYNIKLNAFSFITNGTIYNEEALTVLKELKDYATEEYNRCAIAISNDMYHVSEINRLGLYDLANNIEFLIEDFCDKNNIYYTLHDVADTSLVKEGRANNIDKRGKYLDYKHMGKFWDNARNIYSNELVMDTYGYIFNAADASYKTILENNIGNINNDSLKNLLNKKYNDEIVAFQKLLRK